MSPNPFVSFAIHYLNKLSARRLFEVQAILLCFRLKSLIQISIFEVKLKLSHKNLKILEAILSSTEKWMYKLQDLKLVLNLN